uniref:Uncharacterized protein n=1 Tax=Anopheles funestus TaxID=62324 RepID=A0A182S0R9_ANOFN
MLSYDEKVLESNEASSSSSYSSTVAFPFSISSNEEPYSSSVVHSLVSELLSSTASAFLLNVTVCNLGLSLELAAFLLSPLLALSDLMFANSVLPSLLS